MDAIVVVLRGDIVGDYIAVAEGGEMDTLVSVLSSVVCDGVVTGVVEVDAIIVVRGGVTGDYVAAGG